MVRKTSKTKLKVPKIDEKNLDLRTNRHKLLLKIKKEFHKIKKNSTKH